VWFDFLSDLDASRVSSTIAQASDLTGGPITLRFEAGLIREPEPFDIYETRLKWQPDTVIFESYGPSMKIVRAETPADLLLDMANSRTFEELARSIRGMPGAGWAWLDVYIGTMFELSPSTTDAWDSSQLWIQGMLPWEPWFR
jgi:hypothetical protein